MSTAAFRLARPLARGARRLRSTGLIAQNNAAKESLTVCQKVNEAQEPEDDPVAVQPPANAAIQGRDLAPAARRDESKRKWSRAECGAGNRNKRKTDEPAAAQSGRRRHLKGECMYEPATGSVS